MKKNTFLQFLDTLSNKITCSFLQKNRPYPLVSYRNMTLISSICLLFFSSQIFGQLAAVNPPTGGFSIDGGLRANSPTAGQGDWYPGSEGSGGSGGSVFDALGVVIAPANTETSGRVDTEEPWGPNDDIFTNGSKFNDYVADLRWFSNSAPDKNDIDNALYHVSRDATNNQWIFISGDRSSTSGTSYIDFELLQGDVIQNPNGTFTGTPVTNDPDKSGGGRTLNDIIISMEYTNGGSKPLVYIYQWKKSGNTWSYQLVTLQQLATNAFAETNRTGTESNVPYFAFGSNTYQQYAFVEAAVNITYLINEALGGSSCSGLNIKTLWVKTKASASPTAALKDFITPIAVDFKFGSTEIDPIAAACADDNTPYLLTATPSGGTFSGPGVTGTGPYYFTPSTAGAGTHKITYTSADGTCTGDINIVVKALPTITGTLSLCVGSTTQLTGSGTPATNNPWVSATPTVATISNLGVVNGVSAGTSVITYTNSDGCKKTTTVTVNALPTISGTLSMCVGFTTQLNGSGTPATNNPWVSATPSVATVNNTGIVTGVSAGTSVITYTDINGCIKTATVTVIANPPAPLITYHAPACDKITFSITISSVINGATYTIKDRQGNNISSLTKSNVALNPVYSYTATAQDASNGTITIDGFPAGSGYRVSVSVGGCGSGENNCGVPTPSAARMTEQNTSKEKLIDTKTEKVGFVVFPVPFKDQLTVRYNFDYASQVLIEVFNSKGNKVLSKKDSSSLNKEIQLNLNSKSGNNEVYFVKVTTDKGSSVQKVISSQ